jgi:hypothetical protein
MFGSIFTTPPRSHDEPSDQPFPKCPHANHDWHAVPNSLCAGAGVDLGRYRRRDGETPPRWLGGVAMLAGEAHYIREDQGLDDE